MKLVPTKEELEQAAELLRVLGHEVRLTLLSALVQGERSVADIEAATGVSQPFLSQQLALLRKADLVSTRREAKQVFYSINADRFALIDSVTSQMREKLPLDNEPQRKVQPPGEVGAAMFARIEPSH